VEVLGAAAREEARSKYEMENGRLRDRTLFKQMPPITRHQCLDPRDRIFSLISLFGEHVQSAIRVDYTKSTEMVFAEASWFMVQECANLGPLCFKRLSPREAVGSESDLPSWACDWRNYYPGLPSDLYFASLETVPQPSLSDDSTTFTARGISIDTVSAYVQHKPPLNVFDIVTWTSREAAFRLWKSHFKTYPGSCDPIEVWIRTVLGDVIKHDQGHRRIDNATLQRLRQVFVGLQAGEEKNHLWDELESSKVYGPLGQLQVMADNRKTFISASGYMGLASQYLQEGDHVCILLGCKVPMLIRKEGDFHRLVGECFIWGLMNGEGLQDRKDEDFEDFRLR
jgi:hypothetical protein